MIELQHLTKKYGRFTAVSDLSVNILDGQITGFVGKNGAGKTTTIRCMMDFLKPTSGTVLINGLDSSRNSREIRTFLGYMPSDTAFYENMACPDIFRLTCRINGYPQEKAAELCDYFELSTKKKFRDLSLGNKKKVSIIQSLLKNVKVLVLDEPTSGLDPLMQKKFFDRLVHLRNQGITVFLSSHNLADVQKYCDRVLIIRNGKIADDLNMHEICRSRSQIVTYTAEDGETVSFRTSEDINLLLRRLSDIPLAHLEIRDADVEDEFIKYYEDKTS